MAATSFFGGEFFGGEFFNTPATGGGSPPGGVRSKKGGGKREFIVRLSDVQSRADTAEFLKAQLRLRHPDSAFTQEPAKPPLLKLSKADRARQEKLSADALKAMQIESENEERRIIGEQNAVILNLIVLASL